MREQCALALFGAVCLALTGCGGAGGEKGAASAPPAAQAEAAIPGWVTPSMGKPGVGDAAPDFDLADGAGNHVKLSSLRGSVVVMQFGASFCPFSKAELPHLNQLAKDYAGKNVKVLLVDVDEGDPEYKEYSSRMPLTLTMLRDVNGDVAKTYAPEHAQLAIKKRQFVMIPANLIVDPDGKIAFYTLLDSDHFDAELVALRKKLDGFVGGTGAPAAGPSTQSDLGPPRVGDAAPDFELPDRNGKPVSLASLRGSDAVVHFTAAWCPYCDAEIDAIGRMADGYASSGVKVVLIDVQDKDPGWASLVAKVPKSVILLRDATGDASRRYAPENAQPSFTNRAEVMLAATVVVDGKGKIAARELVSTNPSGGFDPTLTPIRKNLDDRLTNSDAPHVLDVTADKSQAARGSGGELTVHVHIGPDFHVMSNAPSKPNYIPTTVKLTGSPGVTFAEPRYPAPVSYRLSNEDISTFRGDLTVTVPFTVAASAPMGAQEIHGTVHYQACTESRCLFPRDEAFGTTVSVVAKP